MYLASVCDQLCVSLLCCVQLFASHWTGLPGSSIHGIFQARILEWVAHSFFRGSSQPKYQIRGSVSPVLQADSIPTEPWGKPLSLVQLFTTPWLVNFQALLSMQFSRQDYWSRLPFPFPGDLPLEKGSNPPLLHWQADSLPLCHIFSLCVCLYCSKRKI